MNAPVLLDLFSGAGGASVGYRQAGFHVIGVDIEYQPSYPYTQLTVDVMELDLPKLARQARAVAVHASPPCQRYSTLAAYQPDVIEEKYRDLVAEVRDMLTETGLPYVIENVPGAPLNNPVTLCGAMFPKLRVYRHRKFETNWGMAQPEHPKHVAPCVRNGYLPTEGQFMSVHGGKHSKAWRCEAAEAMGVPWMHTIKEVCESIPPAFARAVGTQLKAQLNASEVAA